MRSSRVSPFILALVAILATPGIRAQELMVTELGPPPVYQAPEPFTNADELPLNRALSASTLASRSTIVGLYQSEYLASLSVPINWTGNINSCIAGTTSAAYLSATMDMVNFFRTMTGLPSVSNYTSKNDEAQEAALMMDAANSLSHSPAPGWPCYTAAGDEGAGSSNLALGAEGARAIDLYMEDPGSFNTHVGHRRWILYPRQTAIGTGSTTGANALYVLAVSTWGSRPTTPSIVAWPPVGFVPYQVVYPRWSFSLNSAPDANYSGATVNLSQDGTPRSASIISRTTNRYGDNTLVFVPSGISLGPGMADSTVTVTIGNIQGADSTTVEYTVTIIDPAQISDDIFMDDFEGDNTQN